MAKKKIPKSRKVRLVVFGIPCLLAFLFFCTTILTYTYKKLQYLPIIFTLLLHTLILGDKYEEK